MCSKKTNNKNKKKFLSNPPLCHFALIHLRSTASNKVITVPAVLFIAYEYTLFDTLQAENSAEHAVSHGEGHRIARQEGQTSARLRQSKNVHRGVSELTASKETEVKPSSPQLRSGQRVKEANRHEGNDVLQVG